MLSSDVDTAHYPGLKRWVISSFSGHKKVNDIIYQLCQQTGWDWNQSKQFVEQVARESQKEIHQRRMPLLLGISLLFMASGVAAISSAASDLRIILSQMEPPLILSRIIEYILLAQDGYILIGKLLTGVAIIIAGSIGTYSAVTAAMTGEGEDLLKNPSSRPK